MHACACRYKLIYIPSSHRQTSGGITDEQNDALVSRKADLLDFVNNQGGSLMSLTQVGGWPTSDG